MRKVLVTGSAGFLASHTVEQLHDQGFHVIGIERHLGKKNGDPWEADEVYLGDMRDRNFVDKVISMANYGVINLAGILGSQETVKFPFPSVETNIFGALHCLESCTTWNVPMVQIAVGNHWEQNSYSISKTTAERFALMYAKEKSTKVNVLRALNAIGERQKAYPVRKIMASFVTRALSGRDIEIYGDGTQQMDLVAADDVAKILIDILVNQHERGQVFQAGTGVGPSVNEIAGKVIQACDSRSKIVHLNMRPGETPHSKVVADNPYPWDYRSLDDKLPEIVEWFRDNPELWSTP